MKKQNYIYRKIYAIFSSFMMSNIYDGIFIEKIAAEP